MRVEHAIAMVCGFGACTLDEESPALDETQQAALTQRTLGSDLEIWCDPDQQNRMVRTNTSFKVTMAEGDTLLVGGDALVEYTTPGDDPWYPWADTYSDELANTWIACRYCPDDTCPPLDETPGSLALSATGQNLWEDDFVDGNLSDAHGTRAIYKAAASGTHQCWMIYSCAGVDEWDGGGDGRVTFRSTSSIHHYAPNEYPGMNWKLDVNVPVTSESITSVQYQTWNAGLSTQGDSELVARWSPHVSVCLDSDQQDGEMCDTLAAGVDAGFDWRFVVRQYYGSTLCNSAASAWSHEPCFKEEHHCDVKVLSSTFPIVAGNGNYAWCGTTLSARKFVIDAQMKKPQDALVADLVVSGAPAKADTNLVLYSRP